MYERYTEKARRVFYFARRIAVELKKDSIEPDHLVVGFFRQSRRVTQILTGLEWEQAAIKLEQALGKRPDVALQSGNDIPVSEGTREIMSVALNLANERQQRNIFPAHLMIALLSQKEGVLAKSSLRITG